MKKNYKVRITETLAMTVGVEAHSRDEMVVNEIERGQIAEKKKPAEKKKCEKGIDI